MHYGKARQGSQVHAAAALTTPTLSVRIGSAAQLYPSWWTQRGQTGELAELPEVSDVPALALRRLRIGAEPDIRIHEWKH